MECLGPWNLRRLAQCLPRPETLGPREPPTSQPAPAWRGPQPGPLQPTSHHWDWKSLSQIPRVGPDLSESKMTPSCRVMTCLDSVRQNGACNLALEIKRPETRRTFNEAQVACLKMAISVFEWMGLVLSMENSSSWAEGSAFPKMWLERDNISV